MSVWTVCVFLMPAFTIIGGGAPFRCFITQEVMEKNKKIQQDKKIAYDLKVAEVTRGELP